MAVQNPFSKGYAAIFQALRNSPNFVSLLKPANLKSGAPSVALLDRGNQQDPKFQPPVTGQGADRPLVIVSQRRFGMHPLTSNSTGVGLFCIYAIDVLGGQFGPDAMNALAVTAGQALLAAGQFIGLSPQADGITKWETLDGNMVPRDPTAGRADYVASLGVRIDWMIPRQQFLALNFF